MAGEMLAIGIVLGTELRCRMNAVLAKGYFISRVTRLHLH
jgi:hypothetical protein